MKQFSCPRPTCRRTCSLRCSIIITPVFVNFIANLDRIAHVFNWLDERAGLLAIDAVASLRQEELPKRI
jgi:hypothetical protein